MQHALIDVVLQHVQSKPLGKPHTNLDAMADRSKHVKERGSCAFVTN